MDLEVDTVELKGWRVVLDELVQEYEQVGKDIVDDKSLDLDTFMAAADDSSRAKTVLVAIRNKITQALGCTVLMIAAVVTAASEFWDKFS